MNKRQKKKRFKKLYGSNPEEAIKIIQDFDWQKLITDIGELWSEFWAKTLELWDQFCKEKINEDSEEIINR